MSKNGKLLIKPNEPKPPGELKRLLISIPAAPNGTWDIQLSSWLTAIQVQSVIREFAHELTGAMSDIADRLKLRGIGEKFMVAWAAEQAFLQWKDGRGVNDLWAPMIPDGWSVAIAPVFGYPLMANRNEQVRRFLLRPDFEKEQLVATDFDAVLFIDTDNVPNRQDLHCLIEAIERDDVDIVGGVYCMETNIGPEPIVYTMTGDRKAFLYDKRTMTKPRGLHELKGGGLPTGCLMVKRKVFEQMWQERRLWFKDHLNDCALDHHEIKRIIDESESDPKKAREALKKHLNDTGEEWLLQNVGKWHIGEDIWFCRQAHEMGFRSWVDTRVFWGHIKKADNRNVFMQRERLARFFYQYGQRHADEEYDAVMTADAERAQEKEEAMTGGKT